jgi:hypothetical protein
MTSAPPSPDQPPVSGGAHASLRIGKTVALEASITTSGLLAVAAIVTGAVLGSAAIVLATKRVRDAPPTLPHHPAD